MRIDRLLVDRGLASSRNQAQEMVEAGRVLLVRNGIETFVKKASQLLTEPENFEIKLLPPVTREFVSRGGFKLQGAIDRVNLDVQNFLALDVGLSTGGFTDCLLQNGADRVIGLDVGHGQLAAKLKTDSRVTSLEGINARDLSGFDLQSLTQGRAIDLVVMDVSFISLSLVLPEVVAKVPGPFKVLALVKPQFEVGRDNIGKNGIVKDETLFDEVREKITTLCQNLGFNVEDYFASSITGTDGNQEFFVYGSKAR